MIAYFIIAIFTIAYVASRMLKKERSKHLQAMTKHKELTDREIKRNRMDIRCLKRKLKDEEKNKSWYKERMEFFRDNAILFEEKEPVVLEQEIVIQGTKTKMEFGNIIKNLPELKLDSEN